MQKKKILFVMESLSIGGAEKSLLTILSMFDYDRFDVDLILFRHKGEFLSFLPKQVHLLEEDFLFKYFDDNRKMSPFRYISHGLFSQAFNSITYLIGSSFSKLKKMHLYIGWEHQKCFFTPITKHYDVAIAFLERRTIYYVADLVSADKKIGFIHNDYSVYPYDEKEDMRCFKEFNYIATVSEHCKQVLCEKFPMYSEKFTVIKNMVSRDLIFKMAHDPIPNFKKYNNFIYLCSVGRLTAQKGFDIGIDICAELINQQYKIKWYIVGEGEQRDILEQKIRNNNLKDNVFLVGSDVNPYRWMNMCDVYLQPSRFEGYGITVAEAKALNKRIVASDIPEFREQLESYKNALFADNILDYVNNIINILKKEIVISDIGEQQEIEKIYNLIEN